MHAKNIWRWFWNPEIGAFLALQPVFMKCLQCPLYWTRCQWPLVSKIDSWFSSKFCLFCRLILSLYDSISARNDNWLHKINMLFEFAVILQVFATHLKMKCKAFNNYLQKCSKNFKKIKHHVIIIKQSAITCKFFCQIDSDSKEKLSKI